MKNLLLFWFWLTVASLVMSCQTITPLTPPNPVIGQWQLYATRTYHLPAWFVTYAHADVIPTPTDTVYGTGLTASRAIFSLTIAANHTLAEQYQPADFVTHKLIVRTDTGRWSLDADTVVHLQVANSFYHQLNYRYATGDLVVHRMPQSTLISPTDQARDTVRVYYEAELYYQRVK